jgi:hypothetical protein
MTALSFAVQSERLEMTANCCPKSTGFGPHRNDTLTTSAPACDAATHTRRVLEKGRLENPTRPFSKTAAARKLIVPNESSLGIENGSTTTGEKKEKNECEMLCCFHDQIPRCFSVNTDIYHHVPSNRLFDRITLPISFPNPFPSHRNIEWTSSLDNLKVPYCFDSYESSVRGMQL